MSKITPATWFTACLLACAAVPALADGETGSATRGGIANGKVENSVVKIFATVRYPDPQKPWSKQAPSEISGSGVVLEGNRILTNAHVVLFASQIQIQANQAGDKIGASIVAIAPGIDLAVLKLDNDSFFKTHRPIPRAKELPQVKDAVLSYGYPTGGTELSITKGIVSRIEFTNYNYPVSGLRIQIDAAINPGNSGGPAVAGDKMVGLCFLRAGGDTQNIGYIIPNEEVDLFLRDIADGHYHGKPALHDELQDLENPALRSFLKLDSSVEGIIVNRPNERSVGNPLKKWDVITKIADTPIDDQGMVKIAGDLRVKFQYLVQRAARNGKVPLTIVRAGKTLEVQAPAPLDRPALISSPDDNYPPYFIYGPLVLAKGTSWLLGPIRNNAAQLSRLAFIDNPLVTHMDDPPSAEREELVMISSPFFPDNISRGYASPAYGALRSINGQQVRSLRHAVEILRDLTDDYVVFEFEQHHGETLVFSRQEIMASTERILADNDVRAQGSADMVAVWQSKGIGK
jgi:S1-C subfamily serine protease